MTHPLLAPTLDPTPIFELFRGSYGSELLTAAVAHFDLFGKLADGPQSWEQILVSLQLAPRPAIVLLTALRAMRLIQVNRDGNYEATPLAAEHLTRGAMFDVSGYLSLAADSPGVKEMVTRLRTNRPAGTDEKEQGAAFIFRDGVESAMEQAASARHFTLALAGRAKNVAPVLAQQLPLPKARRLLDVAGGTGIYSFAFLRANPALKAVVLDRPEVLKVAMEMADEYGVRERVEFVAGDMFKDEWPNDCDTILLSNVLHDWDLAECETLLARAAAALPTKGRVLIHDVFLNDDLDGPLAIALYSAALFCFTEGRAYSVAEYRQWLLAAGFAVGDVVPTAIHCGVLIGTKLP